MNLGGVIGVVLVLLVLGWGPARRLWRERRRRSAMRDQVAEWQAQFEAENPVGEPVRDEDVAELGALLDSLSLPCVPLAPDPAGTPGPLGCHMGGPAWLPVDTPWPHDSDGVPLEFLAQIDFAALPPLPDFPDSGVLLLFVGQTDNHGADFDDPRRSTVQGLWLADPDAPRHPLAQPPAADEVSPFTRQARQDGIRLVPGTVAAMPAGAADWRIIQRLDGQWRRPGIERIHAVVEQQDGHGALCHHVGGHPVFVQEDVRRPGHCEEYDRVLLRLTSDDHVVWGDVGEANVLITAADLRARDFSRLAFTWDCS